ncbi:MAG: N-acetylglucosamine kinase [Janthinobacterium lividum]
MTYLGVDGGGSGTALCLISRDGEVLARLDAPSSYYLGSVEGTDLVARVLGAAVPAVCSLAGTTPPAVEFTFLGLPAFGEVSADVARLEALPATVLGSDRYRCDNDMVCGWAGSLGGHDGINVISGTGSMTYGERAGVGVRVGGWGELFGDEGSGYWLGIRALQAFTRMSDGRASAGPLLDVLRDHLGLGVDLDVVDVVLNRWSGARREIASLSRPLVAAARRGDETAAALLAEAGSELAHLVHATRRRLGFEAGEVVPLSYSGGVFSVPEVLTGFENRLDAGYDLRRPRFTPVVGAAVHAARLAGAPLSDAALERLQVAQT